jgi:hypothetical protein
LPAESVYNFKKKNVGDTVGFAWPTISVFPGQVLTIQVIASAPFDPTSAGFYIRVNQSTAFDFNIVPDYSKFGISDQFPTFSYTMLADNRLRASLTVDIFQNTTSSVVGGFYSMSTGSANAFWRNKRTGVTGSIPIFAVPTLRIPIVGENYYSGATTYGALMSQLKTDFTITSGFLPGDMIEVYICGFLRFHDSSNNILPTNVSSPPYSSTVNSRIDFFEDKI